MSRDVRKWHRHIQLIPGIESSDVMVAAVILQSTASAMLNKIKYASLILGSKVLNQSQRNAFTKRMSEVESVAVNGESTLSLWRGDHIA